MRIYYTTNYSGRVTEDILYLKREFARDKCSLQEGYLGQEVVRACKGALMGFVRISFSAGSKSKSNVLQTNTGAHLLRIKEPIGIYYLSHHHIINTPSQPPFHALIIGVISKNLIEYKLLSLVCLDKILFNSPLSFNTRYYHIAGACYSGKINEIHFYTISYG